MTDHGSSPFLYHFVMSVEDLVVEGRLREALNELEPAISRPSVSWELRKEYNDIVTLYDLLLDYFRQGVNDPERQNVFTRLIGRTLVLSDRLELISSSEKSAKESKGNSPQQAFGAPTFWSSVEKADAIQKIRNGAKGADALLLLSSITLSLLQVFDPRKMEVLCEAAESTDDAIVVRAVTAIDIAVRRYAQRIRFYPDVEARLRQLGTDSAFIDMLTDVELQFVRSRDTEEIERRMVDDIIPSMLRSPKAKGKHFITPDDLTDESNPEWSQWLKESGLEEKLQELTELQMNGSDVYMATFSKLKNYPFFDDIANWFRPFDPTHPAISHLFPKDGHSLQSIIMRSGMFCNSDKYSFCLSLASVPRAQLDMLQSQFAEQEEAIREELGSDNPIASASSKNPKPSPRTLVRQYIQDLYRFFHLSPARSSYADPFIVGGSQAAGDPLHTFYTLPMTSLIALFELNFQRRDFPAAISSFDAIQRMTAKPSSPSSITDVTLWQKYGYCHQHNGNYEEALRAYLMADVLKPDHYWTLHHTAQCQRALAQYDDAFHSYHHLAAMKPDNPLFTYRQAECLIQMGKYDESLPLLQLLAYDNPNDLRTNRAIVRTELLLQHPDAALRTAHRLQTALTADDGTASQATDDDLTLIAVAQWLTGHRDEALLTLSPITSLPSVDTLHQLGIDETDIPFLLDLVRGRKGLKQ